MGTRKVAAHFALLGDGSIVRYPLITLEQFRVISVEPNGFITESAGVEFYSGVILPCLVDVVRSDLEMDLLTEQETSDYYLHKKYILPYFIGGVSSVALLNFDKEFDAMPIIDRINLLIKREIFSNFLEAIHYYSQVLSSVLNEERPLGIAKNYNNGLLICSNLSIIKGAELKLYELRRIV